MYLFPILLSPSSHSLFSQASYFVNAGTQSLADAAGECDIALRVLLMLLMKFSIGKVTERWLKGEHGIFKGAQGEDIEARHN